MPDAIITISGNLAADPELRYTQSGVAVVSFTVMQNLDRKNEQGGYDPVAKNGLKVTAWRELAENIAQSFEKGQRVIVTGRLEPQQWQDRESGQDRYGWQLVAEDAGHSTRWATSQATKAQRNGGGQGYSQQNVQRPQSGGYSGQQSNGEPWAASGNQGGYDDPPF